MGYMKHNAIIVTSWDAKAVVASHEKAKEVFKKHFTSHRLIDGSKLVSEIIDGVVNSQSSFLIAPDGSKEGWEDSKKGDDARAEFLDWLLHYDNYCNYIEVRFGGDDEYSDIIRTKDSDLNNVEEP